MGGYPSAKPLRNPTGKYVHRAEIKQSHDRIRMPASSPSILQSSRLHLSFKADTVAADRAHRHALQAVANSTQQSVRAATVARMSPSCHPPSVCRVSGRLWQDIARSEGAQRKEPRPRGRCCSKGS